jgi:hypothetical protein
MYVYIYAHHMYTYIYIMYLHIIYIYIKIHIIYININMYHSFIDSSHITSLKWVTGCLYNMSARRMLSEFPYNATMI